MSELSLLDFYGFLVAVISVLITFLIGWQVFVLFDLRRLRKDISDEIIKMKYESNDLQAAAMGDLALLSTRERLDFQSANYSLLSMMYLLRNGRTAESDNSALLLLEYATSGNGHLTVRPDQKENLMMVYFSEIKPLYKGQYQSQLSQVINQIQLKQHQ